VPACYKGPPLDWYTAPEGQCTQAGDWQQVLGNADGDSLTMKQLDDSGDNVRVRLLLIDTPELSSQDCYAEEAKAATYQALIRSKFKVCLVAQPGGDDKDVYGRLLRYVYLQEPGQTKPVQLNLRLLRQGMARVLYPYLQGNPLELVALATMATAKAEKLGGWAACGWVKPK
jgi:endonuclease YncB( thermonuclease family)